MTIEGWYLVAGAVLVCMAAMRTLVARLPVSGAAIYLLIGWLLGQFGGVALDTTSDARLLELVTEVVVLVSLFTAGLKLRPPLRNRIWRVPLRLAFVTMALTIAAITAVGVHLLDLSLAAALVLAAAIAPTDPVLASDVQVADPGDRDRLRFGLTGEAGLNDGAAFPFVILGLVLLTSDLSGGLVARWAAVDMVYRTASGLAVGALLGTAVGRLVLYLRVTHREAVGSDEFLALGLMASAYGVALLVGGFGFLAVFAAGLALSRIADAASPGEPLVADDEDAVKPESAPAYMAQAVLGFNEQLERILEVVIVVAIGIVLAGVMVPPAAYWFIPLVLMVIRPAAVTLGLLGTNLTPAQRWLTRWLGVRGVGSLYYVTYAVSRGLGGSDGRLVADLVVVLVATSIVVHGVSVTPLMNLYTRLAANRRRGTRRPTLT